MQQPPQQQPIPPVENIQQNYVNQNQNQIQNIPDYVPASPPPEVNDDIFEEEFVNNPIDNNPIEENPQIMLQNNNQLPNNNINNNNQNLLAPKLPMQQVPQQIQQGQNQLPMPAMPQQIQQPVDRKTALRQQRYQNALTRARNMDKNVLEESYAKHSASGKIKMQGGNPSIPYANANEQGAWKPKNLDDNWAAIASNPKNQWIQTFNKAHDFSYNPKMLDPRYAAWTGAKHGTTVYFGDVNGDGVNDVIEVDEDDRIRTFNGYKKGPSKQQLYLNYYENVAPVGDQFGKPTYGVSFKNWYQQTAASKSAAERKSLNTELGRKGMYGYKVKETTINEYIRNYMKSTPNNLNGQTIYENIMIGLANALGINVKLVAKSLPNSMFVSQLVRAVLFKLFNYSPQNRVADDAVLAKISRIANSKKYNLKTNIQNWILQIINDQIIARITRTIWDNIVLNKNYIQCQQAISQLINAAPEISNACQQAYQKATQASNVRSQAIAADRQYKSNPMADFINYQNWR